MMTFGDNSGYGRLISRGGQSVYTGRHVPTARGWLGIRRWPAVVQFEGKHYLDTRRFDGLFRRYEEVPTVFSVGE